MEGVILTVDDVMQSAVRKSEHQRFMKSEDGNILNFILT